MQKQIILGKGRFSGEDFTHILPSNDEPPNSFIIHKVLVGNVKNFDFSLDNPFMEKNGVLGEKGTMEIVVDLDRKEAEVLRNVPLSYRSKGIGKDMLDKAELLCKSLNLTKLRAVSKNPGAVRTYYEFGWIVKKVENSEWFLAFKDL